MKLEIFIAQRLISQGNSNSSQKVMNRIATISIAVSVAVMVLALAIVDGFKAEITSKIQGLTSDIQVTQRAPQSIFQTQIFTPDSSLLNSISNIPGVSHLQEFATRSAIIQTPQGVEGVMINGVSTDFDWDFLESNLIEGKIPIYTDSTRSRETLISKTLAQKLELKSNAIFEIISVSESNPRRDRFRVSGIYSTGLDEMEQGLIIADLATLRRISDWDSTAIEGYQITVADGDIDHTAEAIAQSVAGKGMIIETFRDSHSQIFDWLDMLDMNTALVLIIMIIVAAINMIGGVLILILESVRMVGILQTQGIRRWSLQQIFLIRSMVITFRGIIWGNLLGLGLAFVQQYFKPLQLDPTAYMVAEVPISIDLMTILALNLGVIVIITLITILPTFIISHITPEQTVRFE